MTPEKELRAHPGKVARNTSRKTLQILAHSWHEGIAIVSMVALCVAVVYLMGALYTPSVVAL